MGNVYAIKEETLTAIADAIRGKTDSTNALTPSSMPAQIEAIKSGGGNIEPFNFLDGISNGNYLSYDYMFAFDGGFFLLKYLTDNHLIKNNVIYTAGCKYFFASKPDKTITSLPSIKVVAAPKNNSYLFLESMFAACLYIIDLSNIELAFYDKWSESSSYGTINSTTRMFLNCHWLRKLPRLTHSGKSSIGCSNYGMFQNCYSLREIPPEWINFIQGGDSYRTSIVQDGFSNCISLDEIVNVQPCPSETSTWTSNAFSGWISNCGRLKRLTFATQEDGSPFIRKWKSQSLGIPDGWIGTSIEHWYETYNTGITKDKKVTDAESYARLKNDPDWYTTDYRYSRFNHDSAVEMINSLPDTSAYLATQSGAVNTLKIRSDQALYTDEGSCGSLTEAEIAVATARGWTISFY